MNYVGRILSNFKDFYKEINSATLTGAIDVIAVEQEDGSIVSSPFHVRFGKMGVIRAREKVVDIEVNGQPVPDIHMKLGEAGEAFFVEELEGNETEDEMPAYLATSPLPSSLDLMKEGIEQLHQQVANQKSRGTMTLQSQSMMTIEGENEITEKEVEAVVIAVEGSNPSVGGFEDAKIINEMNRKDSDQSLYMSSHNTMDGFPQSEDEFARLDVHLVKKLAEISEKQAEENNGEHGEEREEIMEENDEKNENLESKPKGNLEGKADSHLETKMADQMEGKLELIKEGQSEEDKSEYEDKLVLIVDDTHSRMSRLDKGVQTEITGEEVTRRAKSPLPWHVEVGKEVAGQPNNTCDAVSSTSSTSPVGMLPKNDSQVSVASVNSSKNLNEVKPMRKRKRKKISKRREMVNRLQDESGSSIEDGNEEILFTLDMSEEEPELVNIARTTSLPMIHGDRKEATEAWASHQYASSCHPFSDGDITPIVSPIGSRPPSPKSDTELEYRKYDAGAQTMLTGDDFKIADNVNWRWGEVPNTPATGEMMGEDKPEEKTSGGIFQFMRATKKMRHQPDQEGIYLDDLELESEIAALYLYQKSPAQFPGAKDEDCESGRGASLPQSPVSMDREPHDVVRPQPRRPEIVPEIAMSLCGGLRQPEMTVPQDKFLQHMISYDELCRQPNLLSNPNLVIKIEDKYYNWQIAGPMVMSALAFQRPLGEDAVTTLIKEHMPKKEPRKSYWMWWRTEEGEAKKGEAKKDSPGPTPIQHSTSMPGTPSKTLERRRQLTNDIYNSTDESDVEKEQKGPILVNKENPIIVTSSDSTVIAMTQTVRCEKYKKTLKLSSEQLKKLKLQPGRNSITFSVTTRYQGTSMCEANIFLWKWNDKVVISDIDGTITKSDVLGQLLPVIGKDWSQAGIAHLYNMIYRNGYKFVYLSARAIGQARITRDYLKWIRQGEQGLPDGPLLLSPSSLISAFHREVIERKPEEFKISCLKDITALFPLSHNPFVAGFGNKINDVWAYREVGIPISRIFTVNHKGELRMEESHTFMSSYTKLSDIVDHFFPPLIDLEDSKKVKVTSGNFHAPSEFSSFTYWREPLPDIETEILEVKDVARS